jgi:hypothetical protein
VATLPADEREGSAYCAASQSGYRWVGRMLGERPGPASVPAEPMSVPAGPASALARRLLATDQGARHIARLIAALLRNGQATDSEPIQAAVAQLGELLAAAPPASASVQAATGRQ